MICRKTKNPNDKASNKVLKKPRVFGAFSSVSFHVFEALNFDRRDALAIFRANFLSIRHRAAQASN